VPDVTGLSQNAAVARLQTAGFGVAVIQKACTLGPGRCKGGRGAVWKQDPSAGTRLPQGSTVTIYASP
jgi:beta-lactam-binding protein with PASTA domain